MRLVAPRYTHGTPPSFDLSCANGIASIQVILGINATFGFFVHPQSQGQCIHRVENRVEPCFPGMGLVETVKYPSKIGVMGVL